MGRIEAIVAWADSQSEWVSDALRRHSTSSQFQLSEHDKQAIQQRVRHTAGFTFPQPPELKPITPGDLGPKQNDSRRALLASLGPVTHLARLLPDQQLSFALDGITLVYGDNGSGKSGYCRITKKIGRSLSTDDLLGNVFEAGDKPRAKVVLRYMFEGDEVPTELEWIDGERPPDALSGMSVFDSRNARLYVDRENRIGFLPSEISMLERHGVHRKEMDAVFTQERQALDQRLNVALPTGFVRDGKIEGLIAKLRRGSDDLPTSTEIETAATWTDTMAAELDSLEASLSEDPALHEARLTRVVAALRRTLTAVGPIDIALTDEMVAAVRENWLS